ncbi:hypothetical protein, partial [Pontiella sp.]|uniref:hypothetical protein n=1 Tax=Pontiella sp. TaxID=2837462 RepID=UPI00356B5F68
MPRTAHGALVHQQDDGALVVRLDGRENPSHAAAHDEDIGRDVVQFSFHGFFLGQAAGASWHWRPPAALARGRFVAGR